MKFQLWGLLIILILVGGCQTTRVSAFLPTAQEYGRPLSLKSSASAASIAELPELMADASSDTSTTAYQRQLLPVTYTRAIPLAEAHPKAPLVSPDTVVSRTIPQPTGPDPHTSKVNMLGGLLTFTGLIALLAAVWSEASWGSIHLGLGALALIPVGVALLLYQGKNGRLRLRRQARREARRPTKVPDANTGVPAATPPVKGNPHLRKVGSVLLILSAILLLIGALLGTVYSLFFFGLPAIIIGLLGLIVVVASL
ncbi:hypothetical protein [Hymenobacter mucosus]|uniref:Uncharacterized protein n=1 Tax=Hymenobacter mucosus TaxID=1411120 RepID=A0A238W2B3_9BACT|nr:hypothetical protein [Hymenobacter mucosus]SNR40494.1 hypothetical protein SAMN06269173_102149 [Hymenobacter mucosus]